MRKTRRHLALAALTICFGLAVGGSPPAGAEEEKPGLLVIFELNHLRGQHLSAILEKPAEEAGLALAVLDSELGRRGAFREWIRKKGREVDFDPDRVVLLGFSKAGPAAVEFAFRYHEELAGLILAAASGIDKLASDYVVLDKAFPIMLVYSRKDTQTPLAEGRELRKVLRKAKLKVTWEEMQRGGHFDVLKKGQELFLPWAVEHSYCLKELRLARQYLKDRKPELAVACRDRVKKRYPKAEVWLDFFYDLLPEEEEEEEGGE